MPGIKRDYNLIYRYLRKYGKAPQVYPLIKIAKEYPGDERKVIRWEKYTEYMKELIETGKLDLKDVYLKEEEIKESIQKSKE